MFVAFWDHDLGNSTSGCSKETLSPCPIRASRISHSTASKGCVPALVKYRRIERPSPLRSPSRSCVSVVDVAISTAPSAALKDRSPGDLARRVGRRILHHTPDGKPGAPCYLRGSLPQHLFYSAWSGLSRLGGVRSTPSSRP